MPKRTKAPNLHPYPCQHCKNCQGWYARINRMGKQAFCRKGNSVVPLMKIPCILFEELPFGTIAPEVASISEEILNA